MRWPAGRALLGERAGRVRARLADSSFPGRMQQGGAWLPLLSKGSSAPANDVKAPRTRCVRVNTVACGLAYPGIQPRDETTCSLHHHDPPSGGRTGRDRQIRSLASPRAS
jgi:hypothetical protein